MVSMLKIGLTGGIGCGKTTVTNLFAVRGIPVIDADLIARQLVEPGKPALAAIVDRFGTEILTDDGHLDRGELRNIVFQSDLKRRKLESILHPLIKSAMDEQHKRLATPYCILCIPLLLETHLEDFVDRILVVDCPIETQIRRVAERDKLSRSAILSILESQVSREERLNAADDIIANDSAITRLEPQVERLHFNYISLSET